MALDSGNESMECRYYLAESNLRLLQYKTAADLFRQVLSEKAYNANDSLMQSESRSRLNTIRVVSQGLRKNADLTLFNMVNLNSEYSDYGINILGNALYFSSMRKLKNKETDSRTLQGYSDIFKAKIATADFEQNEIVWLKEPVNSMKYNEACPTFGVDGKTMYFMRCFGKPSHCEILASEQKKNEKWSKAKKIDLSSKDYSIGHPTLSSDGNTMIFVSDMPNGMGKRDIYISHQQNNEWSQPQNLGTSINTSLDEMFPRLINDSLLIFSSQGHNSFGGLDLFVSVLRNGIWQKAVRLAPGVNTGADDFDLLFTENEKGMFCSNRPGGYGADDIYQFNGFPVLIPVYITVNDEISGKPIANATIVFRSESGIDTLKTDENGYTEAFLKQKDEANLVIAANEYRTVNDAFTTEFEKKIYPDIVEKTYILTPDNRGITVEGDVVDNSNKKPIDNQKLMIIGENGYFDQTATDSTGSYEFTHLQDNNSYTLLMARKGYWTQTKVLDIPDLETNFNYTKSNGFDFDFNLDPIEEGKEIVIKDIFYDFDKATLKSESEVELNKLVYLLENNPNIKVEISSYTDSRGPDDYNMRLSQARAESVVKYLVKQGISKERLVSKGYGETNPLIANAQTEEQHQLNRRTSFKVLAVSDINESEIISGHAATTGIEKQNDTPENTVNIVYKVQVCASRTPIESDSYFKKLNNSFPDLLIVEEKYPDGFYRYIAGTFTQYDEAVALRNQIIETGYPDCFIGVYKNNKRIQ
jgi:outer membrane protein OmpA-like peptidoglycan-associated protein